MWILAVGFVGIVVFLLICFSLAGVEAVQAEHPPVSKPHRRGAESGGAGVRAS
jgi:hypothetical protein